MNVRTTTTASSDAGGGGTLSSFSIENILSDQPNDNNCAAASAGESNDRCNKRFLTFFYSGHVFFTFFTFFFNFLSTLFYFSVFF